MSAANGIIPTLLYLLIPHNPNPAHNEATEPFRQACPRVALTERS